MRILALDLATKTGWAALVDGRVESGVQAFDVKRGESPGMRYLRFNAWLADTIAAARPALVVYEQAWGGMKSGAAAEVALGFATRVQEACARSSIDHTTVNGSQLKKWATGRGNASKPEMVARAAAIYPFVEILDDNHADALLILMWAREVLELVREGHDETGLFSSLR